MAKKFLSTLSLRRATANQTAGTVTSAFLSTLSLRRATRINRENGWQWSISIHALLAESDGMQSSDAGLLTNFYPRSPCGERQQLFYSFLGASLFLSTLSLRRATLHAVDKLRLLVISIHALLAESDLGVSLKICPELLFLSTLSLRRATT